MSEKTLRPACPRCVTWICSACGHKRHLMSAMWVNPYCTRCKGTDGVRRAVRHTDQLTAQYHLENAAKEPVGETVQEDGSIFRWPAPSVDEVPVPGVPGPLHSDGTNADAVLMGRSFATWANITVATAVDGLENDTVTWSELLLCRVFNALEKKDPKDIRSCLKGVSKLVQEWTEDLERRL